MRKLMWFTIGGVLACFLSVYLLSVDILGTCTAVCSVGFTAILILSIFYERVKPLVAALLGATVLFGWNYGFDAYYLQTVRALDGKTVELTVTLTDYSRQTEYGMPGGEITHHQHLPFLVFPGVGKQFRMVRVQQFKIAIAEHRIAFS